MDQAEIRKLIEQGLFTEVEFAALDRFFNGPQSKEPGIREEDGEIAND